MMHTYAHRYTHVSAYTHIHTHILAKTFGKEPSTKMPGSGHLARTTIVATNALANLMFWALENKY